MAFPHQHGNRWSKHYGQSMDLSDKSFNQCSNTALWSLLLVLGVEEENSGEISQLGLSVKLGKWLIKLGLK